MNEEPREVEDQDEPSRSSQVFDISSDDILPVKDDGYEDAEPAIIKNIPVPQRVPPSPAASKPATPAINVRPPLPKADEAPPKMFVHTMSGNAPKSFTSNAPIKQAAAITPTKPNIAPLPSLRPPLPQASNPLPKPTTPNYASAPRTFTPASQRVFSAPSGAISFTPPVPQTPRQFTPPLTPAPLKPAAFGSGEASAPAPKAFVPPSPVNNLNSQLPNTAVPSVPKSPITQAPKPIGSLDSRPVAPITPTFTSPKPPVNRMQDELASLISQTVPQANKSNPNQGSAISQNPPKPAYTTSVNTTPPAEENGLVRKLRTYEGDIAEVMSHRKTSALNITLAENKRKTGVESISNVRDLKGGSTQEETHSNPTGKILIVLLSLILIGGGIGGGYYLYSRSAIATKSQVPVSTAPQAPKSLVPYDSQSIIPIDGLNITGINSKLQAEFSKPQDSGTLKDIVLSENTDVGQIQAPINDLATIMGVTAPDIILRTLTGEWMLGSYSDLSGVRYPFVIVKTNLFQNAFAGMLKWENIMPLYLGQYLQSTSTQGQFKDEIIKNKDVRAYVNASGQTLFSYSFIDNSTLIIAGSDSAISEIVSRLDSQAFIR